MTLPRTWWRSLEQLEGSEAWAERAAREFPEDATAPPEGIPRREMLLLLGASLSMAGLAACRKPVERIVPYVQPPEEIVPGVPLHYATTLPFGLSAWGVVVETHEGRPTKIEGNELHPSTLGSSSAFVQAALFDLYDPDRSRSPLVSGETRTLDDFVAAWGLVREGLGDGRGLAVLGEPFRSPTLARLRRDLLTRYPEARWVTWEPIGAENVLRGVRRGAGQAYEPVLHLDRAEVVVSIDADFLGSDPESIRHARAFADARRLTSPHDAMSRLYAVEGSVSITGAAADHRLALRSSRMGAFTGALARALASRGLGVEVTGGAATAGELGLQARWLESVADDLLAARGRSLVVAGAHLPPDVHAAVAALNDALGNAGTTVTYHEMRDASLPSGRDLAQLAGDIGAGKVRTLVILGGNPAYDAPADLGFADALQAVETSIHLSTHVNETSRLTTWHVPRAHPLESWGDARAVGGTASVIQPLIAPLFDGVGDAEMLAVLATGQRAAGHDLVRETWRGLVDPGAFEREWHRVLHDGLLHGSGLPAAAVPFGSRVAIESSGGEIGGADDLEIRFVPSYAVHDGRLSNVSWLQELPDPATKLTWDNAALISPSTAGNLGAGTGDVVRLDYRGRSLDVPALVLPGLPDHTVTLALGYGRTAAGRVGTGVGANAFALRASDAPAFDSGVQVVKTGAKHALVGTQDHWTVDERGIAERQRRVPTLVRSGTLEQYRRHPEFAGDEGPEHPPLESLWTEGAYDEGYQWGMTVDLSACTGCNACVIACQAENNIPAVGKEQVSRGREMQWIRIDRYFSGSPAAPEAMLFQPVTCMHCENAPCEQVCPVAATVHDREGLNTMVYNRCIGTRYCSNNCPYKVRRFNFFNFTKDTPELLKMAQNPDVTVRSRGVMEKCTFCTQRINRARMDAKLAGRDIREGDVQTACQQACPSRAIEFGNLRDPGSRVARLRDMDRAYVMLAELNNKPRTSYLARIRNPNPRLQEG